MFRRTLFSRHVPSFLKSSQLCFRRLVSSSAVESRLNPDAYNGVLTNFGWVLVKKTHVARGWTQASLNKVLAEKLGKSASKPDWDTVQKYVDEWAETADISEVPKTKKRTSAEVKQEKDMKLFLQQSRFVEESRGKSKEKKKNAPSGPREFKVFKEIDKDAVSFTNAWNYYVAINYSKHEHLTPKERRVKVGEEWRSMSLDQKEVYRQDYARLLQSGKDIFHGRIVDLEYKLHASKKLWEAKERTRLRKMGVLPPAPKRKKSEESPAIGSHDSHDPVSGI